MLYTCAFSTAESPRSDLDNMEDPRAYSPDTDLKEESSASERNVKENSVDVESNQKSDCHCVSLEREDSLESLDSEKPSIDEKATQDLKESLGFGSLRKRPDFEDSRTAHSVLVNVCFVYHAKMFVRNFIRKCHINTEHLMHKRLLYLIMR